MSWCLLVSKLNISVSRSSPRLSHITRSKCLWSHDAKACSSSVSLQKLDIWQTKRKKWGWHILSPITLLFNLPTTRYSTSVYLSIKPCSRLPRLSLSWSLSPGWKWHDDAGGTSKGWLTEQLAQIRLTREHTRKEQYSSGSLSLVSHCKPPYWFQYTCSGCRLVIHVSLVSERNASNGSKLKAAGCWKCWPILLQVEKQNYPVKGDHISWIDTRLKVSHGHFTG